MPKINVLPKEVYSLIAAGEVVERPMSIVKEMIENSIDAGAHRITVEIKNGGTTYIRITDDGCGVAREDVRKVFISHATSKILTGEDLNSISTLGFRGEAMASIAAVAKVEMLTKTKDEALGTRYEISGGEEKDFSEAGCPNGTTIVVRDVFFNVPARMKFLKKDVTEGNSVQGIVDRIALSHPEISFRFIRDGKQALLTSGNGDLKGTVYSVFGSELSDSLMEVDYSYSSMRVSGYVSKPHESRKSRAMQFFFINGRLVKSATAMAALEQAYKNVIMAGRFPACILNIEMDSKLVDVNVHPAKIEVRFVNEKPVFDLIYYGVKTAIETKNTVKEAGFYTAEDGRKYRSLERNSAKIDFGVKPQSPTQIRIGEASADSIKKAKDAQNEWTLSSPGGEQHIRKASYGNPEDYKIVRESVFANDENVSETQYSTTITLDFSSEKKETTDEIIIDESVPVIPDFRIVGEAFKTYIIVEIENSLYYIDKHAAHERMNYEKLRQDAAKNGIPSQVLLSPVVVTLSADEYNAVTGNLQLLRKCGFAVEEFGGLSVLVRETPSLLDGADVKDLITEIAQKLLEHKTDIEPDKMDWIFHSASCRAAVKGGDSTTEQEMELFVKKLLSMPNIKYCPHGRPVMIKISKYEIEKQFGRIQ